MLDVINAWREEISADLAGATTELAEAEAAVETTAEAARLGRTERKALGEVFARLRPGVAVANALGARKLLREDELRSLDGELTLRRMQLENIRRRIADLRLAAEQLDMIAPAEDAAEHAAIAA